MIKSFEITVYPVNATNGDGGYKLNQLLLFLQWVPRNYNVDNSTDNDFPSNYDFGNWKEYFGTDLLKVNGYILNPIKIILEPGEYKLSSFVRIFTIADFSIEGVGNETSILFSKFDLVNEPFHYLDSQQFGRDCIALFASPWSNEEIEDYKKYNIFKLCNLKIRLEGDKWFPVIRTVINNKGEEELHEDTHGVFIRYNNFYRAELSNLNIKLDNGEFTILDGDECDHQEITDCYLWLNNWNDRTILSEFERRREQGCNLLIRGNNKSVLLERNTFIKHGNDEALAFLFGNNVGSQSLVHENIQVQHNSFTYLDAKSTPVAPDPTIPDISFSGGINNQKDENNVEIHDLATDDTRPVHVNTVLVAFLMTNKGRPSEWRNVHFTDNSFDLQGPVADAVVMNVAQHDTYQDVVFANNTLRHSSQHNGKLPGNSGNDVVNGAREYIYSSSFVFKLWSKPTELALNVPSDNKEDSDNASNSVSYYGNTIIYSQHTYDSVDDWYAYEHSCFKIYGGNVDIHDNFIDGTKAKVERSANDVIYGNPDNPISLLHCMPCQAEGRNKIFFSTNKAKGYSVVLRCRSQDIDIPIKNYDIRMEKNSFADGGTIVLRLICDSTVEIANNVCNSDFVINDDMTLSVSGNLVDPSLKICD